MSEPTTGTDGAQGANPQVPPTRPQGGDAQQAQGAGADKGVEVAELQRHIDKLERENADYRAKAREATRAGEKSASLEERLATLEQENSSVRQREREARIAKAIEQAAVKAGYRNPELAVSLVRDSIEVDEDGTPHHIDRALSELLQREPYLGKPTTPDAGGGPRGRTTTTDQHTPDELLRIAMGSGG